jgi:hypothetical protein
MAATTTKTQTFRRAFTVNDAALRRLSQLVSEDPNNPGTITIKCSDGSTIATDQLDTLLDFPNTRTRQIRGIEFRTNQKSPVRASINIDDAPEINYRLVGEDRDVVFFGARINEIISSLFPWYSFIYGGYIQLPLYLSNVIGSVILTLMVIEINFSNKWVTTEKSSDIYAIFPFVPLIFMPILWAVWRIIL